MTALAATVRRDYGASNIAVLQGVASGVANADQAWQISLPAGFGDLILVTIGVAIAAFTTPAASAGVTAGPAARILDAGGTAIELIDAKLWIVRGASATPFLQARLERDMTVLFRTTDTLEVGYPAPDSGVATHTVLVTFTCQRLRNVGA